MTSPRFPEPPPSIPATPISDVDALLSRLTAQKAAWARLTIPERLRYLQALSDGVLAVADGWVEAACRAKGIPPDAALAGEEWLGGPMTTVRNIRLLMEALQQNGQPKPPSLQQRKSGQWVAKVFP